MAVEVVGKPSVPGAQVTQEPCRPAFGMLARSLHHQEDVKEQNRKRRRRKGWEPVRHVEDPNPLRPPLCCRGLVELRQLDSLRPLYKNGGIVMSGRGGRLPLRLERGKGEK